MAFMIQRVSADARWSCSDARKLSLDYGGLNTQSSDDDAGVELQVMHFMHFLS